MGNNGSINEAGLAILKGLEESAHSSSLSDSTRSNLQSSAASSSYSDKWYSVADMRPHHQRPASPESRVPPPAHRTHPMPSAARKKYEMFADEFHPSDYRSQHSQPSSSFTEYSDYSRECPPSFLSEPRSFDRGNTVADMRPHYQRPPSPESRALSAGHRTYPMPKAARKKYDMFGEGFRPEYRSENSQPRSSFTEYSDYSSECSAYFPSGSRSPSRLTVNISPGSDAIINIGGASYTCSPESVADMTPPSFNLAQEKMSTPVRPGGTVPKFPPDSFETATSSFASSGSGSYDTARSHHLNSTQPRELTASDLYSSGGSWGTDNSSFPSGVGPLDGTFDVNSRCPGAISFGNQSLNPSFSLRRPPPPGTPPPSTHIKKVEEHTISATPAGPNKKIVTERSRTLKVTPSKTNMNNTSMHSRDESARQILDITESMAKNENHAVREGLRAYQNSRRQCLSRI